MKQSLNKFFFFFFLSMASGAVSRVFGGRTSVVAGGSNTTAFSSGNSDALLLAFTLLLTCAAFVGVFLKWRQIQLIFLGVIGLPVLYMFAASSLLWTAGTMETLRSCVYLFIYLAASAYLALTFEPAQLVRMIATTMVILGFFSIAGQFLLPGNGDLAPGWTGVFPQKNDLGAAMAIGVASLMVSQRRLGPLGAGSLILCGVLLVLSQSFTAVITAALAVIAILYQRAGRQLRVLLLFVVACVAVLLILPTASLSEVFTTATGKDLTFTGRTEIWRMVAERVTARPILGYGYGAFWTTQADYINQFSVWKPGQAHNGYLDICLNLGFFGLALVFFLFREALRRAKRLRRMNVGIIGTWLQLVVLMLLVRNFAEASFLDLSLTWSMLPIAVISARKAEYLVFHDIVVGERRVPAIEILRPQSALLTR